MHHQLRSTVDAEVTIERLYVLVDGRVAQRQAFGNLLLAVAIEQARERLPEPGRQPGEVRRRGTGQRSADEAAQLAVEDREEPPLARREIGRADPAVQREDADRFGRGVMGGDQLVIELRRPTIPVPLPVADDLATRARDETALTCQQHAQQGVLGKPAARRSLGADRARREHSDGRVAAPEPQGLAAAGHGRIE